VDLAVVAVRQHRGKGEEHNAGSEYEGIAIGNSRKSIGSQGDAVRAGVEVFTCNNNGYSGERTHNDGVQNGSHAATKPSSAGRRFLVTPCAKAAVPTPATLENRARRIPMMATPKMPPEIPSGVNAPWKICTKAFGISEKLKPRTTKTATAESTDITGTRRLVDI